MPKRPGRRRGFRLSKQQLLALPSGATICCTALAGAAWAECLAPVDCPDEETMFLAAGYDRVIPPEERN